MSGMKLEDFRASLNVTFGERNVDQPILDQWINYGYYDVCSAVDFDILDIEHAFSTVGATRSYDTPTEPYMIIKHVRDETSDFSLSFIPKEDFFRLAKADTGEPKRWTLHLDDIYLYPVPDSAYSMYAIVKNVPERLENDEDDSVLQPVWDVAIDMLATQYGYMSLGEENRALVWFNRAIMYIQTRMTDGGMYRDIPGLLSSFNAGERYGTPNA
jgi:hypothetical protein